jgi:large subunit ribosomal protein L9
MKVILRQDVPNLGQSGETHDVAPGYFRNYLQPRGLAVAATRAQLHALEVQHRQKKNKAARERERIEKLAHQLGAVRLQFPVKVGEQGRLYGSITARDIANELQRTANISIDRHKIALKEPLRSLGEHTVTVKLEHGAEASVTVELVPEGQEAG